MNPITDILFEMHSTDNDLWYYAFDGATYFNGPDGVHHQDIETVKSMIDEKYISLKDNGRCVMLKKGQNHLKKHMGVRFDKV